MNVVQTIACIGSRETPPVILNWMVEIGAALVRSGCEIRSGNAPGADQAWARGGNSVDPRRVTLCLPWEDFEEKAIIPGNVVRVLRLAESEHYVRDVRDTHPNFAALSSGSVRLHARNAMIVDGVHLVLGALNPDKPGGGGTGSAFRIAHRYKVCALNVADAGIRGMIEQRLARGEDVRGPVFDTGKGKHW